jgi:hypothetical protein
LITQRGALITQKGALITQRGNISCTNMQTKTKDKQYLESIELIGAQRTQKNNVTGSRMLGVGDEKLCPQRV